MKPIDQCDYLCEPCAKRHGGRWPHGHQPTVHVSQCDCCGKVRALTSVDDYLWPDAPAKEWD